MTAQPCHCAELEAVVERLTHALELLLSETAYDCKPDSEDTGSGWVVTQFGRARSIAQDVLSLSSPAPSSLLARREAERTVIEAARDYTTERNYQNVEACHKDQDAREKVLLDALAALDLLEKDSA